MSCSRARRIAPALIPEYEKSTDSSLNCGIGNGKRFRSAWPSRAVLLDLRAAGIRQADELRDLVERLADGVVARAVEHRHDAVAHVVDRRVAAGDDERLRNRSGSGDRRPFALQVGREDVALEVIDRDERDAEAVGEALRAGDADQQRADESRAGGDRDRSTSLHAQLRVVERARDQRKEMLQMFARGDLRHDAAERLMPLDLRGDEIHAHTAVALEQRDRGFIAGGFDAEDHGWQSAAGGSRERDVQQRHRNLLPADREPPRPRPHL